MPVGNYRSGLKKPGGIPLPRIPRDTFSEKKKNSTDGLGTVYYSLLGAALNNEPLIVVKLLIGSQS